MLIRAGRAHRGPDGAHAHKTGCGGGVVTRAPAKRVAPGGSVFGLDASAALLQIAQRFAHAAEPFDAQA